MDVIQPQIFVLQIIGVLPNVDAHQRMVSCCTQARILVCCRCNSHQTFNCINLILHLFKFSLVQIFPWSFHLIEFFSIKLHWKNQKRISSPEKGSKASQPQPDPWIATVLAVIFSINLSKDPKSLQMASQKRLFGLFAFGVRFFQNIEWFTCPPPLNRKAFCIFVARLQISFKK